jgi:hypothetical protein
VSGGATGIRTLTFGDLDTGVWGAALHGRGSFLVLGTPAGARSLSPSMSFGPAEDWSIAADGVEVLIGPVSEPPPPDQDAGAVDPLCRVRVSIAGDGVDQVVECPGTRWFRPELDLDRFDSLRAVGASFAPGNAIAFLSLRPPGKPGHDADLVSAAVFEHGCSAQVGDARLSTTYSSGGVPTHLSLELWQGEGEDEYPRRAAGETAGQGAATQQDGLELRAELFRLHSQDLEAAGVYLLARSR